MIAGIASFVFIPLLAITFAHLMWAFGSTWPVQDRRTLASTVIGRPGADMPPRLIIFGVAVLVFTSGIWALAMTDPGDGLALTLGGMGFSAMYLTRGIAGFTPHWRRLTPEEPFATFERKLYAPLCLGIGAGFLFLVIWRLM